MIAWTKNATAWPWSCLLPQSLAVEEILQGSRIDIMCQLNPAAMCSPPVKACEHRQVEGLPDIAMSHSKRLNTVEKLHGSPEWHGPAGQAGIWRPEPPEAWPWRQPPGATCAGPHSPSQHPLPAACPEPPPRRWQLPQQLPHQAQHPRLVVTASERLRGPAEHVLRCRELLLPRWLACRRQR